MIETLMALWNRGVGGRLVVMVVTFFCLCICISLLFVTAGGVWGSLFARGQTGGGLTRLNNTVVITASPTFAASATVPVGSTPISVPNPCLASPTGSHGNILGANSASNDGQTRTPATATPTRLNKTPDPSPTVATATTPPVVTPTVVSLPTDTPTVEVTPTDTSTPGPFPTTTLALMPTVPAGTVTPTIMPSGPTVTSPTASTAAASGIGNRQARDGRPQGFGTPGGGNSGQQGQGNCLSDDLVTGGRGAVLSTLQNFLGLILASSLLGTALFCSQMYRMSRKRQSIKR